MKYIVFGFEHYNPLGIVRSLGENGISPVGIIIKNSRRITSKSKYFEKIHFVENIEQGYNILLKEYGKASKDGVFTSDDQITSYFDARYDELVDRFYFNNAGKKVVFHFI